MRRMFVRRIVFFVHLILFILAIRLFFSPTSKLASDQQLELVGMFTFALCLFFPKIEDFIAEYFG